MTLEQILISFVPLEIEKNRNKFKNEASAIKTTDQLIKAYISILPQQFQGLQEKYNPDLVSTFQRYLHERFSFSPITSFKYQSNDKYHPFTSYLSGSNPNIAMLGAFRENRFMPYPPLYVPRILTIFAFSEEKRESVHKAVNKATELFFVETLFNGDAPNICEIRNGKMYCQGKELLEHELGMKQVHACIDGDYCYVQYKPRITTKILSRIHEFAQQNI